MGLAITIKRVKEHHCPECGQVVFTEVVDAEESGGPIWYPILAHLGYYVPWEDRPEGFEDKWYGVDMTLSDEQVTWLMKNFPEESYNADAVLLLVARATSRDERVVVNADW